MYNIEYGVGVLWQYIIATKINVQAGAVLMPLSMFCFTQSVTEEVISLFLHNVMLRNAFAIVDNGQLNSNFRSVIEEELNGNRSLHLMA